jgi:hypothetical protein
MAFECLTGRVRVTPKVQNPPDNGKIAIKRVVDGIGEALRQEAVIAEDLRVDTCIQRERVDVGEQGVEEILTESLGLLLVEQAASVEIVHG